MSRLRLDLPSRYSERRELFEHCVETGAGHNLHRLVEQDLFSLCSGSAASHHLELPRSGWNQGQGRLAVEQSPL